MELEFRRLQKRRLFPSDETGPSAGLSIPGSSCSTGTTQQPTSNKEQPLFTLRQVHVYTMLFNVPYTPLCSVQWFPLSEHFHNR